MDPVGTEELDFLRKAELFSALLDDDLAYVAKCTGDMSVAEGEVIFSAGELSERFFMVRIGEVVVTRPGPDGHEIEIARFRSGEVIGDFDFVIGAPRSATARAAKDCRLLVFPVQGRSFEDLARERPDSVSRVLLRSIAMVSERLRSVHLLISENSFWVRELRRQVYTDAPTGLWSRTFLDEELRGQVEDPTAIVMIKPDRFKELNDAHGHSAGDAAMARIAAILSDETRRLKRGWAVRLRSNETAIVIPKCDEAEATASARRLSQAVLKIDLSPVTGNADFRLTASVAFGLWPDDGKDLRGLVDLVSTVLLRAWRDGGARIYRARKPAEAVAKRDGGTA